jgi:hypothetical protein
MRAVPHTGGGLRQAWRHRHGRPSFLLPAPDRTAALGEQLIQVHQELRERLGSLREAMAGGTGQHAADAGAGEDLLSHCLS